MKRAMLLFYVSALCWAAVFIVVALPTQWYDVRVHNGFFSWGFVAFALGFARACSVLRRFFP